MTGGRSFSTQSINYYDASAERLADLYESMSFAKIHADILDVLPSLPSRVLDVGAGSGRDAAALCSLGFDVTAVEPSPNLRAQGILRHQEQQIHWVDDTLPELLTLGAERFEMILVSAVWMHLAANDRPIGMGRLFELSAVGGQVVLTLREGAADAARSLFAVDPDEVQRDALRAGFDVRRRLQRSDQLGRAEIRWTTFLFQRPMDQR